MWKAPFDIFHNVVKYNLNFPHCGNYNPQCEKNIVRFSTKLKVFYTMWKEETMLTKPLQLKSEKNFVEEVLIVSTIWKLLCDIFHNVESTI